MATSVSSDACNVHVIDEAGMPPALDREIREFLCVCFPEDAGTFARTRHWHGTAPAVSVVCRDHQPGLAGHVGVIVRTIQIGRERRRIFGIQNMAVAPDRRGTPVGAALMQAALAEARRRGIEHGVLFCIPGLEKYYARTGWRRCDVDVRMDWAGQRDVPVLGKNICMAHELAGQAFPQGNIHLLGPDW